MTSILSGAHDPMLVVLSMGVATWASFVALNVASRIGSSTGWTRIGWIVAAAHLYPDITLTAAVEQIGLVPYTLLAAGDNVWNFGAGVTAPLFHDGVLRAQERAAEDNFDSARATYQQVVLQSFAQVADTLDALAHDTRLLGEQRTALDSSRRSLDLTRRAYQADDIALLQVLDASRLYQRARLGYAQAEAQRYVDTAQLFLAMGGGWWERSGLTQGGVELNRAAAR